MSLPSKMEFGCVTFEKGVVNLWRFAKINDMVEVKLI